MGLFALAAAILGGCGRAEVGGEPDAHATALIRPGTLAASPTAAPGIAPAVVLGPVSNPYAHSRAAMATGRQLFDAYNCSGCHAGYAGGGMGPNLRDSVWIYGSSDAQIFSTIAEGRPNGMPAWGGKIPEQQIWQIIAYLRTLGTAAEPTKPPRPSTGQ